MLKLKAMLAALVFGSILDWAAAASPVWGLNEVYSNADRSIQFVVHSTLESGQQYLGGLTLVASGEGMTNTFTFPGDLPGDSAGRSFLIATQGFADLKILQPDYVVPNGFFPVQGGVIWVAGHGYEYLTVPTDGTQAFWLDPDFIYWYDTAVARNFSGGMYTVGRFIPPSDSSRDYLQKAYVAYYGRPADPVGQDYWASRLDAESQSRNALIVAFGESDEFVRHYGALGPQDLVTKIYQQTLARAPDPGGLDYYLGEMEAGRRTLQSIALDILNGATAPPDSTVVVNKLDVAAYYTAKVVGGCAYGTEQAGIDSLSGVTADAATVDAAKAAIDLRCGQ